MIFCMLQGYKGYTGYKRHVFSLFHRCNSCNNVTFNLFLDGVPLCFMLRRFSRPNRARGEAPVKMGPPQADERASSRAGEFLLINNSCSMDFSAGYPATSGSIW